MGPTRAWACQVAHQTMERYGVAAAAYAMLARDSDSQAGSGPLRCLGQYETPPESPLRMSSPARVAASRLRPQLDSEGQPEAREDLPGRNLSPSLGQNGIERLTGVTRQAMHTMTGRALPLPVLYVGPARDSGRHSFRAWPRAGPG